VYKVELTQEFVNTHAQPLEATYIFPLPDRAAVTGMRMVAADRTVEAKLQERGEARETYDRAIAAGQRASIAEEDRPDVFTMRVGNIVPGERVSVILTLAGPLSISDGAALFRFPLVVAPRYIPGAPLGGEQAGAGWEPDTDAVPDASRITPPVLLPGFPNPVRLSIGVGIDPGGLPLGNVRSSLHAVSEVDGRWRIAPGERADRDFVLRLDYDNERTEPVLALHASEEGEGTFELTVLPPAGSAPPRPRDVVLVLDRSGSMGGWKMVSARRAAARIVDSLTDADRFAVLTFDHVVDHVEGLPAGLVDATDRNRFRAVRHLSTVDARGGTEMLAPLREGRALLTGGLAGPQGEASRAGLAGGLGGPQGEASRAGLAEAKRDLVLVLVTDGQVGNEDQILGQIGDLTGIRVHTIGIDRAVNAGFLGRLASAGGGRFELVESEDQLDDVMAHIHRRIGSPLVTGISLSPAGMSIVDGTVTPVRLPDLFPGVPLVIRGRYTGDATRLAVRGTAADGTPWQADVRGERYDNPAATAIWARGHVRDLEDLYAVTARAGASDLEKRIVAASLRFGVLCRFTAYVAVDDRVVAGGGAHHVVQPVEPVSGWDMFGTGTMQPAAYPTSAPPMAKRASGPRRMMAGGFAAGRGTPPPAPQSAPVPPPVTGAASPAPTGGPSGFALDDGLDLDRSADSYAAGGTVDGRVARRANRSAPPPDALPYPAPPTDALPYPAPPTDAPAPPSGMPPFMAPPPTVPPRQMPPTRPVPGVGQPPADLAAAARVELDALRAAANGSADGRLRALARAAQWLAAAGAVLIGQGAGSATVGPLADLAAEVKRATEATPELWAKVEAALVGLAGPEPAPEQPRRKAFWKR
jgi:Ca-activated chloride channel family protein